TAAAPSAHSSWPASRSSSAAPAPVRPVPVPSSMPSPPRVPGSPSPHTLPAAGEGTLDRTVDLDLLDDSATHLPLDPVEEAVLEDPQLGRPRRRRCPHHQGGRIEPLDGAVRR